MSQAATLIWFVHTATKGREGPFSLDEIHRRISAGELLPQDQIWCPGMTAWKTVQELQLLPPVDASASKSGNAPVSLVPLHSTIEPAAQTSQGSVSHTNKLGHSVELESISGINRKKDPELPPEASNPALTFAERAEVLRLIRVSKQKFENPEAPGNDEADLTRYSPPAPADERPPKPPAQEIPASGLRRLEGDQSFMSQTGIPVSPPSTVQWAHGGGGPTRAPHGELNRGRSSSPPNIILLAVFAAVVLGGASYALLSNMDRSLSLRPLALLVGWFNPIPRLKLATEQDDALYQAAASASLSETGPRVELVTPAPAAQGSADPKSVSLYVVTNLPDGFVFELRLQPIEKTLVGEPPAPPVAHATVKRHVAKVPNLGIPMGYYWVYVLAGENQPPEAVQWLSRLPVSLPFSETIPLPLDRKPIVARRVFVGGLPDLGYQTQLQDFVAVQHGRAQAELEVLGNAAAQLASLLAADNEAAKGMQRIGDSAARGEAWGLFQETWQRNSLELEKVLSNPIKILPNTLKSVLAIQRMLQALHAKHGELVSATPAPGARSLSPSSVNAARITVDAQAISADITVRLQDLRIRLDTLGQMARNPGTPIIEGPGR